MTIAKLRYIARCVWFTARGGRACCPFCQNSEFRRIDSKWGVVELRECTQCALLYRAPSDSVRQSEKFYEEEYESGETTKLPLPEELERLRLGNFQDFGRSYLRYMGVLAALGVKRDARILDFGASWGYGVFQFREAGFDAAGFEVSRRRGEFARRELGVEIMDTLDGVESRFDVFFSSHVMEHLPDLRRVLATARRVTKPGGWFVALTPNGSAPYRHAAAKSFHHLWGFVHPVLIQDKFMQHVFASEPYFLASDLESLEALRSWNHIEPCVQGMAGWELFVAARLVRDESVGSFAAKESRSGA